MSAHIPMLLTLTSMLLLTVLTVACALAYAVSQGALDSRVRIDADVRILPAVAPTTRLTPVCSRATLMVLWHASQLELRAKLAYVESKRAEANALALRRTIPRDIILNRAFDDMLAEVDTFIEARVLAARFQQQRFAS